MVQFGMSPMEALQAATSVAAHYMGWGDRVGALKPGYLADIIAVEGDPLADIGVMERVAVVIKGGLVFKSPEELLQ
jgi:imidazolonepropionase-like amidohydrolase